MTQSFIFRYYLVVGSLLVVVGSASSQQVEVPQEILEKVATRIANIEADKAAGEGWRDGQLESLSADQLLQISRTFGHVENPLAKMEALQYASRAVKYDNRAEVRQEAVALIVRYSIGSTDPANVTRGFKSLSSYSRDDFSAETRAELLEILHRQSRPQGEALKVVGIAGAHEATDYVWSQVTVEEYVSSDGEIEQRLSGWDALLTIGRLGDEEIVAYCVDQMSSRISDFNVRDICNDAAYLRHSLAVDFLNRILMGEVDDIPDDTRRTAEKYAIKALSASLIDFPQRRDSQGDLIRATGIGAYTEDFVQTCKSWMTSKKAWSIRR